MVMVVMAWPRFQGRGGASTPSTPPPPIATSPAAAQAAQSLPPPSTDIDAAGFRFGGADLGLDQDETTFMAGGTYRLQDAGGSMRRRGSEIEL